MKCLWAGIVVGFHDESDTLLGPIATSNLLISLLLTEESVSQS
jgi:hypothetical protein